MEKHLTLPSHLGEGSVYSHPAGQGPIAYHYHSAEEWLQVTQGAISFVSAGGTPYSLEPGEVLQIPAGEIHRVEIGPAGATYTMWVLGAQSLDRTELDDEDCQLMEKNLKLPEIENNWDALWDGGQRDQLPDNEENKQFLLDFLSPELAFCSAGGTIFRRDEYLKRAPADAPRPVRSASDAICVVHRDAQSLFLRTDVITRQAQAPRQAQVPDQENVYVNHRMFFKEEGSWRCRMWINHRHS